MMIWLSKKNITLRYLEYGNKDNDKMPNHKITQTDLWYKQIYIRLNTFTDKDTEEK